LVYQTSRGGLRITDDPTHPMACGLTRTARRVVMAAQPLAHRLPDFEHRLSPPSVQGASRRDRCQRVAVVFVGHARVVTPASIRKALLVTGVAPIVRPMSDYPDDMFHEIRECAQGLGGITDDVI